VSSAEDQPARDSIRTAHDQTLFVEAGAGTGKTTALVARVVEMVASGRLADMAGLAAITFTENAAAELRTRIREGLEEAARDGVDGREFSDPERDRCRQALRTLDEATISTLLGFAARILSEVPLEAGLPPGFSVSDAITAQLESARSWRRFVDDLLDDESVQDHVVAGLTLGLTLDKLRELADTFSSNWDLLLARPFAHRPLPPVEAAPVLSSLRKALEALDDAPEDDALTNHLRADVRPAVEELSTLNDPFDVLEALTRLSIKKNPGTAGNWKSHGGKQRVVDELTSAREAQTVLLSAVGAAVTETLCKRVQDYVLEEAERRRAEGRLEFHDLLVLTRDVLRVDSDVRRRMNERFTAVLVDEFQDTDPLQVEIVCLVAGDCGANPPEGWEDIPIAPGRLFFVGDPKQSIYRFRRADVRLYERVGKLHALGHTSLEVNFRSVAGVVQPVNDLFGVLMKDVEGQVSYATLKWHREGGEDHRLTMLGGPVEGAKAPQIREREAAHIAAMIQRAKRDEWPVERDKNDPGRGEPLSYADVAVLLPTRTSLPALEKALQTAEIPYRVESRSLVWATDAVRDVITILQSLVNPADEVAVVAALRHHGLACSDVHLTEWAAAGGRWNYLASPPEEIPSAHPVATGMAQLRTWHDLRWWMPAHHLVERLVRELRLVELTAELKRPRDHWRRLRFVIDQARAFADAGGSGLSEFVAWAVEQIESEADVLETAVPEPDDDSVRILTVHGSKGLEFPLTILSGLGVPPKSLTDVVWGGPRPEARLKAKSLESAAYAARAAEDKSLNLAESVRLLYVAMTRARDYLVVGCYHKPVKGKDAQPSHAQSVWKHLHQSALVSVEPSWDETTAPAAPEFEEPPSDQDVLAPATFLRKRADLLAAVRARVAASATSLVTETDRASAPTPSSSASKSAPATAGTGAALGSAVHGVLELVDLAGSDTAEMARVSALLCDELGIPELTGEVQTRVQHALTARRVADAGASGRYWREVYVVARDGERYVEGYIDLLVEEDEGVFVVDYKTDRVSGSAEVAAKADHYGPQLRAYAAALRQVPGVEVSGAALLLVGPEGATDVEIDLHDEQGGTDAGPTSL
jgi:ATP-dependent helicase/nuclease subunit A